MDTIMATRPGTQWQISTVGVDVHIPQALKIQCERYTPRLQVSTVHAQEHPTCSTTKLVSENTKLSTTSKDVELVPTSSTSSPSLLDSSSPASSSENWQNGSNSIVGENLAANEDDFAVAVVGMGCRFPGANTIDQFWKLIDEGTSMATPPPVDRFGNEDSHRRPQVPFWGNFIEEPDCFDHRFFNMTARESEHMDPQQRIILQVAYETLQSAKYFVSSSGRRTTDVGCYVGIGSVDYADNVACNDATAFSATGTLRAFISGRVSHYFGWTGPSITFDTACSSSAIALHSAFQALKNGDCAVALSGGVNVMTSPYLFQNLAAANFLTTEGPSRAFDTQAKGYCRGEGAGLVLLKPLSRAIADHDCIFALLKGSAVNQGSNCSPITVPDSASQCALYLKALQRSNLMPSDVTYVEAHGTGTPVGDPIEYESVRRVFDGPHRANKVYLGAVKDNIGHLEAASGIAALLKVILMIQRRTIPKQANFLSLNPSIPNLESNNITVPRQSKTWKASKLIALVSNYGAAGSNAAFLVQEHVGLEAKHSNNNMLTSKLAKSKKWPVMITASSSESLSANCDSFLSAVLQFGNRQSKDDFPSLVYNATMMQNFELDRIWACASANDVELTAKLQQFIDNEDRDKQGFRRRLPVVLCFPGQSSRKISVCRSLFESCTLFREQMIQCDLVIQSIGQKTLFPGIFVQEHVGSVIELHCRIFVIQYASAQTWIDCGLKIDTMIGHSFGQLTALCIAGSLSLRETLWLIIERARLIEKYWGSDPGIMLAIEGDKDIVDQLVDMTEGIEFTCFNSPRDFVVAGTTSRIYDFESNIESTEVRENLRLNRLDVTHAYHSRLTSPILSGLHDVARSINFHSFKISIETCSENQSWSSVNASSIVDHMRHPVHFSSAVTRTVQHHGPAFWLDAGCGFSTVRLARKVIQGDVLKASQFQTIDLSDENAHSCLAQATSALWEHGSHVQFWPFHESQAQDYRHISLPPYQFEKTRHWVHYKPRITGPSAHSGLQYGSKRPFIQLLPDTADASVNSIFGVSKSHEIFALCSNGHAVLDHALCPASLYIDIVTRAALSLKTEQHQPVATVRLKRLEIISPLGTGAEKPLTLALTRDDPTVSSSWRFKLASRASGKNNAEGDVVHATGIIIFANNTDNQHHALLRSYERLVPFLKRDEIWKSPNANGMRGNAIYNSFSRVVRYADYYQGIKEVYAQNQEVFGQIMLPQKLLSPLSDSYYDPLLLDNFLQVAGIHLNSLSDYASNDVYLCTAIDNIVIQRSGMGRDGLEYCVYSNFERISETVVTNDIFVKHCSSGNIEVAMIGVKFKKLTISSLKTLLSGTYSCSPARGFTKDSYTPEQSPTSVASPDTDQPNPYREHEKRSPFPTEQKHNKKATAPQGLDTDILSRLKQLLGGIIGATLTDLKPESTLADLGVDSLLIVEVLKEIKEHFDIDSSSSSSQEISSLDSINSIAKRIESYAIPGQNTSSTTQERSVAQIYPDSFTSIAISSYNETKATYDEIAEETEFSKFCATVSPMQSELVVAYVVEAFEALGCEVKKVEAGKPLPTIPVIAKHNRVVAQMLRALERANLLSVKDAGDGPRFSRTKQPTPALSAHALSDMIIEQFPQHAAEHTILRKTGERLADCLSGRADALSLLFHDVRSREVLQDVYTDAPMFKTGSLLLARYLRRLRQRIPRQTELKILELGAGTGGTTDFLIEALSQASAPFMYTFSDISLSLVNAARTRFAQHQSVEFDTIDIEQDPDLNPKHIGQYDVIVSANCIHATKNLVRSCSNIRRMLKPGGGIVCLMELTKNLSWFDLVFGLLEGWWLFDDGRQHALADVGHWEKCLYDAGFKWVDWSAGDSPESELLRVIMASTSLSEMVSTDQRSASKGQKEANDRVAVKETILIDSFDSCDLFADIYYPSRIDSASVARPVALMIHGGGHVMLSRADIRMRQTQTLISAGSLPVSIDYRLCPELTLLNGPMHDVAQAFRWVRESLPFLPRRHRPDVHIDPRKAVAVGWSTGGHLAMTLAWTTRSMHNISPPDAILSFYCPSDYEDPCWSETNVPQGAEDLASQWRSRSDASILSDIRAAGVVHHNNESITAYNPPPATKIAAPGGWLATTDSRSRILLYMNIKAQTLPVLLRGLDVTDDDAQDVPPPPPPPSQEAVQTISPLAHIRAGAYTTPTFIVHGTLDDLIPWQQAQRTHAALWEGGVDAELAIVTGAAHLFDAHPGHEERGEEVAAVRKAYEWLAHVVGL